MALLSDINGYYKEPSTTVRLNGNRIRDVVSIQLSSTIEGSLSTANIRTITSPAINPEARVVISQGYSGDERTTFTGFVDSIEYNEGDNTYTLSARDVLKKAMDTFLVQEVKFGHDPNTGTYYYSTYTNTDGGTFTVHEYASLAALNAAHPETTGNYSSEGVFAHAVVQWLLHMSGLAEGSEIQVDNTNFYIGDLGPAKFHLTSVYDACNQIANLIGWRVYADAAGVARFRKKPRQPGGYSSWTYTDKREPYNILRITPVTSNTDLRNYVEVRGASGIRYVARASSPYIGNTPYRGVLISDELIDTPGIATFVAQRVLSDLNRLKTTVSLEADGNPTLTPGSTLNIESNKINGKFLVEQIQTTMTAEAGYHMTISAAAYTGDTKFEEDTTSDVVASFVPQFVSVLGDPKVIVEFEGAGSYSNRGIITNYFWQWPDGSNTNGASSQVWFTFDMAAISNGNSQTVVLTVTDSLGNTGTTSSGITYEALIANNTVKYRAIYGALNTIAVGSVDGGQIWQQNAIPAISVAASNFGPNGVYVASGHALFGTSDGKIYKTVDTCVTMVTTLTPGGEVTDIHIPELDSSKAYAVTSTGKVYYSDTSGDTWRQIGTFAFPLRQIKAGFTDYKYVQVVGSGIDNVYQTFDLGANWARVTTGRDVLWATDGASTNYYLNTAGVITGAGTNLSFNGGGNPSMVAGTVKIFDDGGLMGVDSTGQHWNLASGVLYQTQFNSANKTKHMIRDGELPVVYYATASGISKSLTYNETIQELYYPTGGMPTGGWGYKVAYGPLASVVIPGRLVMHSQVPTNVLISGFSIPPFTNTGLHVAVPGNQWWYITVADDINFVSVTPGHIIWVKNANPGTIGKISFAASGVSSVTHSYYTITDDTDYSFVTAQFTNNLPDYGDVRFVRVKFPASLQAGTITDFLSASPTLTPAYTFTAFNATLLDRLYATRLAQNDTLFSEVAGGTAFVHSTYLHYNYLTNVAIQQEYGSSVPLDIAQLAPKFPPNYYFIGDAGSGDQLITDWLSGETPAHVVEHASYQVSDVGYYHTASGIFRVQAYGNGDITQVFTAPSGTHVHVFSVTPGSSLRSDCLATVVGSNNNMTNVESGRTYFSTDGGDSWTESNTTGSTTRGVVGIWYIAETPS